MVDTNRYLICSPDHYDVDYVINPWMAGHVHRSSRQRAQRQWEQLVALLGAHATVERIEPQPGVPDLVFTANAGVVVDRQVVLSRFHHPERQREEPFFQRWFEAERLPGSSAAQGSALRGGRGCAPRSPGRLAVGRLRLPLRA